MPISQDRYKALAPPLPPACPAWRQSYTRFRCHPCDACWAPNIRKWHRNTKHFQVDLAHAPRAQAGMPRKCLASAAASLGRRASLGQHMRIRLGLAAAPRLLDWWMLLNALAGKAVCSRKEAYSGPGQIGNADSMLRMQSLYISRHWIGIGKVINISTFSTISSNWGCGHLNFSNIGSPLGMLALQHLSTSTKHKKC